ncbi:unnamed protein product [Camellia sinensis]
MVGFYGNERSTEEKLPLKTDQDTLREGYRSETRIKSVLATMVFSIVHCYCEVNNVADALENWGCDHGFSLFTKFYLPRVTKGLMLYVSLVFIRSEEDDLNPSWEQKLVKRYYDKLFKEYPLQTCFVF